MQSLESTKINCICNVSIRNRKKNVSCPILPNYKNVVVYRPKTDDRCCFVEFFAHQSNPTAQTKLLHYINPSAKVYSTNYVRPQPYSYWIRDGLLFAFANFRAQAFQAFCILILQSIFDPFFKGAKSVLFLEVLPTERLVGHDKRVEKFIFQKIRQWMVMITRQLLRPEKLSRNVSRSRKENIYVDIPPERVNGFLRVKKVVSC